MSSTTDSTTEAPRDEIRDAEIARVIAALDGAVAARGDGPVGDRRGLTDDEVVGAEHFVAMPVAHAQQARDLVGVGQREQLLVTDGVLLAARPRPSEGGDA